MASIVFFYRDGYYKPQSGSTDYNTQFRGLWLYKSQSCSANFQSHKPDSDVEAQKNPKCGFAERRKEEIGQK